jgi:hypothetical protein
MQVWLKVSKLTYPVSPLPARHFGDASCKQRARDSFAYSQQYAHKDTTRIGSRQTRLTHSTHEPWNLLLVVTGQQGAVFLRTWRTARRAGQYVGHKADRMNISRLLENAGRSKNWNRQK